jgi:hypothetical protein
MPKRKAGAAGAETPVQEHRELADAEPADEVWFAVFRNVVQEQRDRAAARMGELLAQIEPLPLDELTADEEANFPEILLLWSVAHEYPGLEKYQLKLMPDGQRLLGQAAKLAGFVMSLDGVLRNIDRGRLGRAAFFLALRHLRLPDLTDTGRPSKVSRDLIRLRAEKLTEPGLTRSALAARVEADLRRDGLPTLSSDQIRKTLREMGTLRPAYRRRKPRRDESGTPR